jgi:hypothetical protein
LFLAKAASHDDVTIYLIASTLTDKSNYDIEIRSEVEVWGLGYGILNITTRLQHADIVPWR